MIDKNDTLITRSPRGRRIVKNVVESRIVPTQYSSIHSYLYEFYTKSSETTIRTTNAMHFNREGFVHAELLLTLPNRCIANMMSLLVDILADRVVNSDNPAVVDDAKAYYELLALFVKQRIAERQQELENDILMASKPDDQ